MSQGSRPTLERHRFAVLVYLLSVACGEESSGPIGAGGAEEGGAPPVGAGQPLAAGGPGGQASGDGAGGAGDAPVGGEAGAGAGLPCDGISPGQPAPPAYQTPNDCTLVVCNGGVMLDVDDPTDLPLEIGIECFAPACVDGEPAWIADEGLPCTGGVCNLGGTCVQCLSSADCGASPYGPICDVTFQACVECLGDSDCIGNPAGELCDLSYEHCGECAVDADCPAATPICEDAQCVECAYPSQCPGDGCGLQTCVNNTCGLDPLPAGSTPIACFPYFCDGASTSCNDTCLSDADCQGQTCVDGACIAGPCDVDWYATHVPMCDASPGLGNLGALLGIDAQGAIYSTQETTLVGGAVVWSMARRSPAGGVLTSWSGGDGLHNVCNAVLGPLGGVGRSCYYSYQFVTQVTFDALEYGWGEALFDGDGPPGATGYAVIDGVDNVFFSASAGPSSSLFSVHDIQGNLLPDTTTMAPSYPPQVLPIGFDAGLLALFVSNQYVLDWAGNISLVGTATGPVDLGGGELAPIGPLDVIVAKFDANGDHVWSHRFEASGTTAQVAARSFGLSDGSVIVTGDFSTANFGSGPLTQSGSDKFLLKLDSTGDPVCAKTITGTPVTGPLGETVIARDGPVVVDGLSLGSVPSCGGVVFARLHP